MVLVLHNGLDVDEVISNAVTSRLDYIPGEPKKSPLRLLLILQQCMGIFVRNLPPTVRDYIFVYADELIELNTDIRAVGCITTIYIYTVFVNATN